MPRECRRYSPFIIVEKFQARALIVQRLPRRPKDRAAHARFVSSPSVRQKATGSTAVVRTFSSSERGWLHHGGIKTMKQA
jgi:hypothetical protein